MTLYKIGIRVSIMIPFVSMSLSGHRRKVTCTLAREGPEDVVLHG